MLTVEAEAEAMFDLYIRGIGRIDTSGKERGAVRVFVNRQST